MHMLTIHKLGPIQHCELLIKPYTILTGYQASGKSTIAKAIYFFRTLKDDIYQQILRREYNYIMLQQRYISTEENVEHRKLTGDFESMARNKFLSTFGTSYSMERDMQISYRYSDNVTVTIKLEYSMNSLSPNFVWVDYSHTLREFLINHNQQSDHAQLQQELSELFNDTYETVYIPAGRSALTVMGSQFSYFYSTMDDAQKRLLDSCTRDYLERVMRLRPQFSNGLEGLLEGEMRSSNDQKLYREALKITEQILKGKYTVSGDEERIWFDSDRYVKINFASSGQQECVWTLNLLCYYLVLQKPVYFIIEEPESNLFPESQKLIVELISLVVGTGNAVLLTTHSPYVLGAVNNLLYAGEVGKLSPAKVKEIVSQCKWIDGNTCEAYFVEDGVVKNCIDDELQQIDNSLLDKISRSINDEYDTLFEIIQEAEGGDSDAAGKV